MAGNLLTLAKRMFRVADKIDGAANEIKKQVATVVARDLITVTPVDTSRALSNWIATNGSPANFSVLAYSVGSAGSTKGASMSAAIAAALKEIDAAAPGVPIFLTNNLRYIRRLNDGYSKQAPAGFVERAALIGRKTVESFKLGL